MRRSALAGVHLPGPGEVTGAPRRRTHTLTNPQPTAAPVRLVEPTEAAGFAPTAARREAVPVVRQAAKPGQISPRPMITDISPPASVVGFPGLWREVVSLTGREREEFLTSVALPRLERLVGVAEDRARPWTEVGQPARAALAAGEPDSAAVRA